MSDLDDFFAKRDKKKKSKKFFTANPEILASKLEENDRKEQQAEVKAAAAAMVSFDYGELSEKPIFADGKDDDWKDYEEQRKDYSGLKIETLKIESEKPDDVQNNDDERFDEDRDAAKKADGSGPWNRQASSQPTTSSAANSDPPAVASTDSPKPKYVLPALRASVGPSSARRSKQAPDINNEVYFPSLAATITDPALFVEDKSFEPVKSGMGQQNKGASQSQAHQPLALNNKFSALEGGEEQ